jgi:selenocysteine lyase/cysteine desulfurase
LGIVDAIDYYNMLGAERKETRLRYLQNYWVNKVRGMKNIVLNTPDDPLRSCAIANVGITGIAPADMAKTLFEKHNIFTAEIDRPGIQGCRITPNIYTSTADLDKFVAAIAEMSGN